jgi:ribonucleoside-diphosphate reductase beta chain
MGVELNKKTLWNPEGDDALEETLIGGNPTGMLNFNKSKYKWADSLFKQMLENTWFPEEVDTSNEGRAYKTLSEDEKFMYDMAFAQLSFNDSLQAENLVDNINGYVTNKIVNACLTRQAFEEVIHSKSYAVLLADAVENSDEVFELYRSDLTLRAKNTIIAENYSKLTDGDVTVEKLYYAFVANQILEGVYFLSGFATIYTLSDVMRGSADMIAFIHRDENTHLALFSNMIREAYKENPDEMWFRIRPTVIKMFDDAYRLEVNWMKYITRGRMTDAMIEQTVAYFVRDRMKLIGMYDEHEDKYGHGRKTPLVQKLESFGKFNDTKTNFFEGNVKNYSKGSLDNWDEDGITDYNSPQETFEEAIRKLNK